MLPKAELEQLKREPTPPPEEEYTEDEVPADEEQQDEQSTELQPELSKRRSMASIISTLSATAKSAKAFASQNRSSKPWRDPEVCIFPKGPTMIIFSHFLEAI